MPADRYETLARECHVETPKVKGSRFIADAFPVGSVESAEERLLAVRRTYHDATHHCYAYRIGSEGTLFRSSDDGEPSGSAGAPILRQIEGADLSDILVVVTRYYGGTKLGTGGLVRAYGEAARMVLAAGRRRTRILLAEIILTFEYDDTDRVMRLISRFNGKVVDSQYAEQATITIHVPRSTTTELSAEFIEALSGRGTVSEAVAID